MSAIQRFHCIIRSSSETKYLLLNVPNDIPAWANFLVTVIKDLVGEIKTLTKSVETMSQLQDKIKIQETVTTNLSNENLRLQNAMNKLQRTVDANVRAA